MDEEVTRVRRADAVENRSRLLAAARVLFARDGLDVPMREIAREAGVGPATLYRHFPTKQDLATEAFAAEMAACRAVVDDGLADPSAWRGLCTVIERLTVLHARNLGFTEAFLATFPHAVDLRAERRAALDAVAGLARRAQAEGELRRDFVPQDLVLTLTATRGLDVMPESARPAAARRLADLLIGGLHATVA
ncbi:TetR/AcrR family transcriptional regulator [Actinomycetospora termitidis]|uniref:Helix-turn-helix domain-containing protein n=1 Tax=Actinomycetospora termitidis TaxID=3053470 RepID=A0ABT7MCZ0_9PSEU|nr:TetR/AcrR family transcriptional regulator [Actinomycetospora sp. Odt1-22]MDL5158539.1 helix-turn-helix domain-containing protein [Actinomycetospora sp. Odt1-22]